MTGKQPVCGPPGSSEILTLAMLKATGLAAVLESRSDTASTRASLAFYNTPGEIDLLCEGIECPRKLPTRCRRNSTCGQRQARVEAVRGMRCWFEIDRKTACLVNPGWLGAQHSLAATRHRRRFDPACHCVNGEKRFLSPADDCVIVRYRFVRKSPFNPIDFATTSPQENYAVHTSVVADCDWSELLPELVLLANSPVGPFPLHGFRLRETFRQKVSRQACPHFASG